MKTIAFVAAVVAATVAVSAATTPAMAKMQQDRAETVRATYNAKSGRYCIAQTYTGSRVPRIECRTKEAWADAGVQFSHRAPTQLARR